MCSYFFSSKLQQLCSREALFEGSCALALIDLPTTSFLLGELSPWVMALQLKCEGALSTFLQSVLVDLATVIKMRSSLFDFKLELAKMEKKLTRLQDILVDGERRRLTERSVNKWMDDLKDLVYDIDDIVDEINIEMQQLQEATTSQHPSNNYQVTNFSSVYDRSISIKSRICEGVKRVDDLAQEANDLELRRDAGIKWLPQDMIRPETSASIDDSEIYGREEDQERMVSMLLTGGGSNIKRNYDVVCIVGMGGLGKTTLAQLVFNDVRVEQFFEVKSWACVSDVFDVPKTTKDLIDYVAAANVNEVSPIVKDVQSLAALQVRLKSIINGKRFLLVLDDVWTTEEWDKMKAPLNVGAKGSKILVTTRSEEVVHGISNERCHRLGLLNFNQCWAIFKGRAFGSDIDASLCDHQDLTKVGEDIVKKCGGLPLAVKTVGAMLRGAGKERWEAVLQNELWVLTSENNEVHPALRLSYYYLPGSLKGCFEYFALFPSDYKFRRPTLICMWIAEGLIDTKHGTHLPEEIGSRYYDDLKGRSLIQENDTMHDILHHLACIVSGKFFYHETDGTIVLQKSVANARHVSSNNIEMMVDSKRLRTLIVDRITNNSSLNRVLSCSMLRLLDFASATMLELPSSIGEMKHLRHFRMRAASVRKLPDSICTLRNLQLLDLSKCYRLQTLPNDMYHLVNLRYLKLLATEISILPESVCDLPNLRVLDVTFCRALKHLPTEIGNLKSLQELLLSSSPIWSVPQSITNVTCLHVLDVNTGTVLPPHIGKLNMLKGLKCYPVGKEKGCGIDELKDLNKLEDMLWIERMENIDSVDAAQMADMISKKHIKELRFSWSSNYNPEDISDVEITLEALEPHAGLKALRLYNYGGQKIPFWMWNVRNLTHLVMSALHLLERVVGIELPSLEFFCLLKCTALVEISMTTPKLKRLCMRECVELKPAALVLLPSDIVAAQLERLECDCGYLNYFMRKIAEATNVSSSKIRQLRLVIGEDDSIPCFPTGWRSILPSMDFLSLEDLPSSNGFNLLPNADHINYNIPPSLRYLVLSNCRRMRCLPNDLRSFSTKTFEMWSCPDLVSLDAHELPMSQRLESLLISDCSNLKKLPSGLSDFTSLSFLSLYSCPNLELHPCDVLPANFVSLKVDNCPKFEEELEKGGRDDWSSLRD